MMRDVAAIVCSVLLLAGWSAERATAQADKAQSHVAAARAAAYEPGHDFIRVVGDPRYTGYGLCEPPNPKAAGAAAAAAPAAGEANKPTPPKAEWYAEPQKVFDNLYYVGGNAKFNHNAWAVTTSAGIILIDSGTHYSAEELLVNGLKKVGLDPAQVKYLISTEGEPEFYGGGKLFQDRYKTRVLVAEAGWNAMAKNNQPAQYKPAKDMVITDGQKLTLGDVTLTFYLTPGHSPGDTSVLISPLKDGNQKHVGSVFSGRGWGGPDPTNGLPYFASEIEGIKTWGASAKRYKTLAEAAGADVFLAKHDTWDRTLDKLSYLRFRKPGGAHPFVSKSAVSRYQTILSECMDAQLVWRTGN